MSIYRSLVLFTFPMVYSFHTRYKGVTGVFAWLIKYFLPCLMVSVLQKDFSLNLFIFGIIYIYEFYELGYIQNDCETIKKESHLTLRLSQEELSVYERFKYLIISIRLIEIAFISWLLYFYGVRISILIVYACTLIVFMIYNHVRNGFCLVIHLVLMMLRYTAPLVIATGRFDVLPMVLLLFIYPITLFVERSVKGKFEYRSKFLSKFVLSSYEERYVFRIKYYACLLGVFVLLAYMNYCPILVVTPVILLLLSSIITFKNKKLQYNK